MKCPKCGYNSFEFLDACKKCGAEFLSFKKTHRINAVILAPAGSQVASVAPVPPDSAASPLSGGDMSGEEFSWEAPLDPQGAAAGFESGYQEDAGSGAQDQGFSGFSFSDDPVGSSSEQPALADEGFDAFSFEEPAGGDIETSPFEMKLEEPSSAIEDYENMISLDSVVDTEAGAPEVAGPATKGDFELDDFPFSPEPVDEDIFPTEEKTVAEPVPEKKKESNLTDFEKEFEQIFSFGDVEEDRNR